MKYMKEKILLEYPDLKDEIDNIDDKIIIVLFEAIMKRKEELLTAFKELKEEVMRLRESSKSKEYQYIVYDQEYYRQYYTGDWFTPLPDEITYPKYPMKPGKIYCKVNDTAGIQKTTDTTGTQTTYLYKVSTNTDGRINNRTFHREAKQSPKLKEMLDNVKVKETVIS